MTKTLVKNEQLLEKILDWDLSKVVDFAVKENPTIDKQAILSSEDEYKHFIYLVIVSGTILPVPTQVVDLIWHSHVLHTKDYMSFCDQVAGKFIHHSPEGFTDENFAKNSSKISEVSKQVFGNVVFDFNKQDLVKNVNFQCCGQKA
ncbi:MAG: hypothetical protein AAGF07_05445 [Patescibacteria group bacterium]